MADIRSYLAKIFAIADPDARIRTGEDLMTFDRYSAADTRPAGAQVGDIKRIPAGAQIRVDDIRIEPAGSSAVRIFADVRSADGATKYGWISTRNFDGRFINETLGDIHPASEDGKYGPNAAWKSGKYIGQKVLVQILDGRFEIERICLDTLDVYFALCDAAAKAGVRIALTSGFRNYYEQKYLYEGWTKFGRPRFNPAAPPGSSLHQSGVAFDIDVAGAAGNATYDWLARHATSHGFLRTVNKEPWHWEYDPPRAKKAKAAGTFKTPNVHV